MPFGVKNVQLRYNKLEFKNELDYILKACRECSFFFCSLVQMTPALFLWLSQTSLSLWSVIVYLSVLSCVFARAASAFHCLSKYRKTTKEKTILLCIFVWTIIVKIFNSCNSVFFFYPVKYQSSDMFMQTLFFFQHGHTISDQIWCMVVTSQQTIHFSSLASHIR